MPVMEIIRHKTFAVIQKTAKSVKVSCHESFMVYVTINPMVIPDTDPFFHKLLNFACAV